MRFRYTCAAIVAMSLLATPQADAANILIISDALDAHQPSLTLGNFHHTDDTLVSLLEGLGHTVDTAGMHQGGTLSGGAFREGGAFSTLPMYVASNLVDLIVFSRATGAGAYDDDKKGWNELDVPLLLMNGFLPRGHQWGWATDTHSLAKTAADFDVVVAGHSFLTGVDTTSVMGKVPVFSTDVTFVNLPTDPYVAGAQAIATIGNSVSAAPALVDIPAGTVFGGDADVYGTSSKRRVFFAYENYFTPSPGGAFNRSLASGGVSLIKQTIASMLANPTGEPADDGGGEDDGGGRSSATSPEPTTAVLFLSGLLVLVGSRLARRRRQR